MQIQRSFGAQTAGTLYLVPTPIGNLDDMTVRAVNVLKEADVIAAEDTRNTQKLLNHFAIATKQVSFHEHNTQARIPALIARLEAGETVAQVSDAGMPSLSDPGKELVAAAVAAGITVVPLPGANAATTALIASGLPPQPFLFYGFLPRKASAQEAVLRELAAVKATVIFYESPYRLAQTLNTMGTIFGAERPAVLARELTKRFEEFARGTLGELAAFAEDHARGEFVVLVGPAPDVEPTVSAVPLKTQVVDAIEAGAKPNDAIKAVAKANGLKKQVVYNAYHDIEGA